MIGETLTIDGTEYVVVWAGGELLPERDTKPSTMLETTPDRRKYTKTDLHAKPRPATTELVDNFGPEEDTDA